MSLNETSTHSNVGMDKKQGDVIRRSDSISSGIAPEREFEQKRTVSGIIRAFEAYRNTLALKPATDELHYATERAGGLSSLLSSFEQKQLRLTQLRAEDNAICEDKARLSSTREKLGLFHKKEKQRMDEDLAKLQRRQNETRISIGQQLKELQGFSSQKEIEDEIESLRQRIEQLDRYVTDQQRGYEDAMDFPEAWETYLFDKDVRNEVNRNYPITVLLQDIKNHAGTVLFGRYPQKADGNEEPIEWQILKIENTRVLVLSKYALDSLAYQPLHMDITWQTCALRWWLINQFQNTAFTKEEQELIPNVTVKADRNPSQETDPGKDTTDKVFLLSIVDVDTFFDSNSSRYCKPTEYTKSKKEFLGLGYNGNCWWWLRSPGSRATSAANIDPDGNIKDSGMYVTFTYGVRPAIWIDLEAN